MLEYIENLKAKPEHIRKRFAFIISFSFTFLVFAGWMLSYGFKPSSIVANSDSSENSSLVNGGNGVVGEGNDNQNKATIEAPVSSLTASAIGAWNDIKSLFSSSNKAEYSADNVQIEGGR